MPPRREKDDDNEYKHQRAKNNEAVRRSRFKAKQRKDKISTRANQLKKENQILEEKVKALTNEMKFLRELFLVHAAKSNMKNPVEGTDLEKLLEDIPDDIG